MVLAEGSELLLLELARITREKTGRRKVLQLAQEGKGLRQFWWSGEQVARSCYQGALQAVICSLLICCGG
jgi:hypothetical protein